MHTTHVETCPGHHKDALTPFSELGCHHDIICLPEHVAIRLAGNYYVFFLL